MGRDHSVGAPYHYDLLTKECSVFCVSEMSTTNSSIPFVSVAYVFLFALKSTQSQLGIMGVDLELSSVSGKSDSAFENHSSIYFHYFKKLVY